MDFTNHFLSKNVYFNICHCKNSKVTVVNKFQKFRVDTPLKPPVLWLLSMYFQFSKRFINFATFATIFHLQQDGTSVQISELPTACSCSMCYSFIKVSLIQ